jgi:hypothetical protein
MSKMNEQSAQDRAWFKSSFSGSALNNCVEVALLPEEIAVRDSKDREGPVLVFTPAEWQAFLAGVRADEFDLT